MNTEVSIPGYRKSISFAEGGGEFLESLQKKLNAEKINNKQSISGVPEDMMKGLDVGEFDRFINE
jgi:hypothetical protein